MTSATFPEIPTYTLTFLGDLMIACAETTEAAVEQAVSEMNSEMLTGPNGEPATADDLRVVEDVTLTNDEPESEDRIVYSGQELGWLTDKDGVGYEYAVQSF